MHPSQLLELGWDIDVSRESQKRFGSNVSLEISRRSDHVLLMDLGWHELQAIPPHNRLDIVCVGPERVERVVGTNRQGSIVANEATAKVVARIDWMC